MPPSPNGVLNVASAADVGDRPFHAGAGKEANPGRAFGMVRHGPQWRADSSAFLQGLVLASERIIMGRMSAGWERFLSGEPESSSWPFTSLVCSTRLDARLGAVFDERSLV